VHYRRDVSQAFSAGLREAIAQKLVNLPSVHAFLSTLDLQRLKRDPESARFPAAESHLGIWKLIIPVAIVVLAVTGYFYLHRTPKLSDKDSAVVERLMEHRFPLEKICLKRKVRF
jgi:hypothetical protein